MSLTSAHATTLLDNGIPFTGLGESTVMPHDPFNIESTHHVLETVTEFEDNVNDRLECDAFISKMQTQCFDALADVEDEELTFVP